MLKWLQLDAIDRKLTTASDIADNYAAWKGELVEDVVAWLEGIERELQNNRLAAAATVAALRTGVLASGRGVHPNGLAVQGRVTRRKLRAAAAVDALTRATDAVNGAVEADRQRLAQARELVRRLAVVARAKGLCPEPEHDEQADHRHPHWPKRRLRRRQPADADALWARLLRDSDTQSGALQVESMVGAADAALLLDQELERV